MPESLLAENFYIKPKFLKVKENKDKKPPKTQRLNPNKQTTDPEDSRKIKERSWVREHAALS